MNGSMNDRWLRWSLTAIAGLLVVIAAELSVLIGPVLPRAHAQIPDGGKQRKELLEAQRKTNATLESILQHLRTQTIKVEVVGTDKETRKATASKPRAAKK